MVHRYSELKHGRWGDSSVCSSLARVHWGKEPSVHSCGISWEIDLICLKTKDQVLKRPWRIILWSVEATVDGVHPSVPNQGLPSSVDPHLCRVPFHRQPSWKNLSRQSMLCFLLLQTLSTCCAEWLWHQSGGQSFKQTTAFHSPSFVECQATTEIDPSECLCNAPIESATLTTCDWTVRIQKTCLHWHPSWKPTPWMDCWQRHCRQWCVASDWSVLRVSSSKMLHRRLDCRVRSQDSWPNSSESSCWGRKWSSPSKSSRIFFPSNQEHLGNQVQTPMETEFRLRFQHSAEIQILWMSSSQAPFFPVR